MNRHGSMNRIYRLIWSAVRGVWIPAAENARGQGKRASRPRVTATLTVASLALGCAHAQAGVPAGISSGPSGGVITAGSGSIAQSGALTTITQASPHLSLTWNSFNIPTHDIVDFVQPSARAIAVNRILDVNGTQILGDLNANGHVWLINPNGIVFGPGAEVNVGGLVASTLALDVISAPGDTLSFSGGDAAGAAAAAGAGSLMNQGTIHAAPGGYVALLARQVSNSGIISAQLGTVALGAGSAATLRFLGTHLVSMRIDQSVLTSVVDNGGLVRADGGQVLMTAGAQKALLASVVNNTGVIEARTLDHQAGTISLSGGMSAGTVNVGGTLDASAPTAGNGGAIETSAAQVEIASTARVTTAAAHGLTGSWLIDPTDFAISAGAASQSTSGIGASTLESELAGTNVSIATSAGGTQNGDINVNAPVSWSSNMLTLTAANNINVNAVMTVSGSAKVDFEPGVDGNLLMGFANDGSFAGRVDISSSAATALTIAGQVYTVIDGLGTAGDATTAPPIATLQGMAAAANLGGHFALGGDIDASATATWNACSTCNNGAAGYIGFSPIGNSGTAFVGMFDGLGHTISHITMNLYAGGQVGLFGQLGGYGQSAPLPTIRNIGLLGGAITAGSASGGSVGSISYVGSLVGVNYGVVRNSASTAAVSGFTANNFPYLTVGGLVGSNYGLVSNSHATGNVFNNETSYGGTGGLVGQNAYLGTVDRSYATGSVTGIAGSYELGGLVGTSNTSTISNSYSSGDVSAGANSSYVGGLAGGSSTIINSYATGNVSGGDGSYRLGGLVGAGGTSTSNSYATGTVTVNGATGGGGNADLGGLFGASYGSIHNSYATGNIIVTGVNMGPVGGLVGMLSAGSVTNSYASGSLAGAGGGGGLIGEISNGGTTSGSFWNTTTSGSMTSPGVGLTTAQMQSQSNFTSATTANGGVNPAWDFGATWVMYEGHTSPLLQVFMTPLTVTGTVAQTYDAAAFAPAISALTYSVTPDFSHLYGTVTIAGDAVGAEHPGTYSFTPGGLYSDQQGYIITAYAGGTLTITPAPLTVAGTTASKVYDGTTSAPLSGGRLVGVFAGDSVTLIQAGNFASARVGSGIAVTAEDRLAGPSALDYTLVEPTGIRGTISPVGPAPAGNPHGADSEMVAAYYASGQLDANFIAPQWGAVPQFIDASPSIDVVETASEPATTDAGVNQDATSSSAGGGVVINVAMKIGATGTLKVESGGLRLPDTHTQGNP